MTRFFLFLSILMMPLVTFGGGPTASPATGDQFLLDYHDDRLGTQWVTYEGHSAHFLIFRENGTNTFEVIPRLLIKALEGHSDVFQRETLGEETRSIGGKRFDVQRVKVTQSALGIAGTHVYAPELGMLIETETNSGGYSGFAVIDFRPAQ